MLTEESIFKALQWCLGMFIIGIPGTVYYVLLRRRYELEHLKRQGVLMSRVWASMAALVIGLVGLLIMSTMLALVRIA